MLSELIRTIYNSAGMDWQTAEKIAYAMLVYMERKLPPAEYEAFKRAMLGDVEYTVPDRSAYPGYYGELPDQARPTPLQGGK
jgi:hypothetical protein